jgi:hypothetical protein
VNRTQVQTNTQTGAEARTAQVETVEVARPRASTVTLVMLTVLAGVFAIGAWGWVLFARENGSPTGLFTYTDFPAITIASRLLSEGRAAELYNLDAQLEGQRRLIAEGYLAFDPADPLKVPYPYTPFIAMFMTPLVGVSPLVGMAVWDLINIALMAAGLWFLLSALPLSTLTRRVVLLAGLTSLPFIVNLEQGQSSGITMFALGVGIALLKRERDLPAGLALGLLALKVQWLPFLVLVLLWKRRWKALAGTVGTGLALMLLSTATIGLGWVPGYVQTLMRAQQYARELLLDPWYSHSFPGGLTALLGRGTDDVVRAANLLLTVALAGLLLYLWRGRWQPATSRWDGLMAVTLLAALLTNLQLNTHDLCLMVLPAALGISFLQGQAADARTKMVWYSSLWTLYVATALFLGPIFQAPLRLTTMLMLVMLGLLLYVFSRQRSEAVAAA